MAAEERKKAGHEGPPIVGLLQNAFVTEDPDRDWPMVRDGIGHQLGVYAGWWDGTDVKGKPLNVNPPDEATIRKTTAYGTPEEVVDPWDGSQSHGRLSREPPDPSPSLSGDGRGARRPAIELLGTQVAPRLKQEAGS